MQEAEQVLLSQPLLLGVASVKQANKQTNKQSYLKITGWKEFLPEINKSRAAFFACTKVFQCLCAIIFLGNCVK